MYTSLRWCIGLEAPETEKRKRRKKKSPVLCVKHNHQTPLTVLIRSTNTVLMVGFHLIYCDGQPQVIPLQSLLMLMVSNYSTALHVVTTCKDLEQCLCKYVELPKHQLHTCEEHTGFSNVRTEWRTWSLSTSVNYSLHPSLLRLDHLNTECHHFVILSVWNIPLKWFHKPQNNSGIMLRLQ